MKTLEIDSCVECKYFYKQGELFCSHPEFVLEDNEKTKLEANRIPEWCPLPKTSQQSIEADAAKPCECTGLKYVSNIGLCALCGGEIHAA